MAGKYACGDVGIDSMGNHGPESTPPHASVVRAMQATAQRPQKRCSLQASAFGKEQLFKDPNTERSLDPISGCTSGTAGAEGSLSIVRKPLRHLPDAEEPRCC